MDFKDYKLVIYGNGPDKIKLQNLAIKLGIDSRCEFPGTVKHVAEHIEKAAVFVLASNQEGMPNALIEAMSLGLPCISTDCPCGGPRDLIKDGVNGLLIPIADKEAMTVALKKLLSDPEFADRLGAEASKLKDKFTAQAANAKWKEYFDSLMGWE